MGALETRLDRSIEELVYRQAHPHERVRVDRLVQRALADVVDERIRQEGIGEEKRANGIPWLSCSDLAMADDTRYLVLGEEVGEVANALLEAGYGTAGASRAKAREELVQVAAVAIAWIQAIDHEIEVLDEISRPPAAVD